ncbi:hypothetical protein TREMEDRAFT_58598 [Tremella mesenterica DSM 1558]|uniref:uncharacterized protein n=1 Tax=Tremella mesenterica (strain ATCC 24925 / CBS 8224 / DSM 1558 / NBRC 9311 / NRRL Y-6157 / RJB 2259-6 / UBC 559-6) TaxID=578456 RepID=UPI0003F48DF5|nr:uncharacterized protein TREMEDRAFT_58598 [Tremella mesenterica DSM 1558]EIW72436.1 hypothetical protein TREMEDRAFT_58598 [Tremella mesenterica DSM 1558]
MPRPRLPSPEYTPSSLPPNIILTRLFSPRGSGNWVCHSPDGIERLVEISTRVKRSKVILVKGDVLDRRSGDFSYVNLFPPGGKVVGEIIVVLEKNQVKGYKKSGEWPEEFDSLPPTNPQEPSPLIETSSLDISQADDQSSHTSTSDTT